MKFILLSFMIFGGASFAENAGERTADQIPLGSEFVVSAPAAFAPSQLKGSQHSIDLTFSDGDEAVVGLKPSQINTYCSLHLESSEPFQLHGSQKKNFIGQDQNAFYYTQDGSYSSLVITEVRKINSDSSDLTHVNYSVRMDEVEQDGRRSTVSHHGYMECGAGMVAKNLKIRNVLYQIHSAFTLKVGR